ncbi:MAG: hypothetical protein M1608_11310 [Candidatus Omnitrophica bacterium]|nr:hypothetical protein [Candidatus Omnitrophota bacterium]
MTSATLKALALSAAAPRFRRQGGAWQLCLESIADLRHALELDDALWVANSAPVATLAVDPVFLSWLDQDGDGRIREDAVREAIRWFLDHLQAEPLGRPGDTTLAFEAIRPEGPESAHLHAAARKVARRFGNAGAQTVSLDQVRQIMRQVEQGGLDRPGLVRPEAAASDGVRQLIEDVLGTLASSGANPPPSAITIEQLEQFLVDTRDFLGWLDESQLPDSQTRTPLMPLGAATMPAFDLFAKLTPRLDPYFTLCDAVRFNLARANKSAPATESGSPPDWNDPNAVREQMERAPVAWPTPDGKLNFETAINPLCRETLEAFRREVLEPLLGGPVFQLDAAQWQQVKRTFAPHVEWRSRQPATPASRIPAERLRRYLGQPELADRVRALIADSHGTAFDLENLRRLEKLLLFQAYLLRLTNSFVNFSDLYHPEHRALFEMGTLVMDGRRFTFSVKVVDRALHARFSNASNMFVLYAEIIGDRGTILYEVAVPVTGGVKGTLQADKWGTFIDCNGRMLNAHIVQTVENPVSLREAIAAPFKRLGGALMARFGEKTAEQEKKLETLTTQTIVGAVPPASQAGQRTGTPILANPGGILAGGGIAIAALGSSLAFITSTLSRLDWTTILASLLGAAAAVIVPVALVAMVKLAGRDLSCMLEGSGWGINARMALTRTLAGTFTRRPTPLFVALKAHTRRRLWWLLLVVALALGAGALILWNEWVPGSR